MTQQPCSRAAVAASLEATPIIAVVRCASREQAGEQARLFIEAGLELIEITFSVPQACELVRELHLELGSGGPPWIGMGTVTNARRAQAALDEQAAFLVTPNVAPEVARLARAAERLLVMGALSPSEIVQAHEAGADLVKVYPLPPVGGPAYLGTVRQPLADIPMLAAGGFGVEEIPAYRAAGARAFGIGAPLLADGRAASLERIARAVALARGEPG